MALVVVGLLAAPSLGVINVKLTADQPLMNIGQSTTIRIWAQGTVAGIYSLAGSITAVSGDSLAAVPGSIQWAPEFVDRMLYFPFPIIGTAGVHGGWNDFWARQPDWGTPNPDLGRADYIEVGNYTVQCVGTGMTTLAFSGATVNGLKPLEVDKTGVLGTLLSVQVEGVPEPVSLALLAVGVLAAARRRVRQRAE
jgi:hypothetical protein